MVDWVIDDTMVLFHVDEDVEQAGRDIQNRMYLFLHALKTRVSVCDLVDGSTVLLQFTMAQHMCCPVLLHPSSLLVGTNSSTLHSEIC